MSIPEIFRSPIRLHKTGIAFPSWPNGTQWHFITPAGFQSARDIAHDAEVFRRVDQVWLLSPSDLAVACRKTQLALHGVEEGVNKRPTIIDTARASGVAKSAVSLVSQGSASVKDECRLGLRAEMAEIGHVSTRAPANLHSVNVGLIGSVVNDLHNPFFAAFATSAQMALSARVHATVNANTGGDGTHNAPEIRAGVSVVCRAANGAVT